MWPKADIPVVQVSLDRTQQPAGHYALGRAVAPLRRRGVLILGSGNIVHNLRLAVFQETAYGWALEFDALAERLIRDGDHRALIAYDTLGETARLAIPTAEHYLPLLSVLGAQEAGEAVRFFAEGATLGSISMRGVQIG
jgi:4,5-DOPA dioxygenase extradiol